MEKTGNLLKKKGKIGKTHKTDQILHIEKKNLSLQTLKSTVKMLIEYKR
jgi:hypothetical protein